MLNLLKATPACLLIGCGGLDSGEATHASQASLLVVCAAPVALQPVAMNDQQIEVAWGKDRDALRECRARHAALAASLID